MSRIVKWVAGIAAVLLLAVIAVMVIAVFVFDPDDYREVVADLVHEQTGRKLEIDGDLSINVLPCCSVSLRETRLSNPPGKSIPSSSGCSFGRSSFAKRYWSTISAWTGSA
jgi:uncharacterized protein involved in outer membrane biogenesis